MSHNNGEDMRKNKAEKISALRTEDYFRERASRGNIRKANQILRRAGDGKPPRPGDDL